MRKFLFKDTDEGVEVIEHDEEIEEKEDLHDDDTLTPEEISALKTLAANVENIIALLEVEKREHAATSDEDEDEDKDDVIDECSKDEDEDEDEDGMKDEDEEEIVVKSNDSLRSFGTIAKKSKARDSVEEDDISIAWAKRYGG